VTAGPKASSGGSLNNVKKTNSGIGKQLAQAPPFFSFSHLLVWSMQEGVLERRKSLALERGRRSRVHRKSLTLELFCRRQVLLAMEVARLK
jgi:hypothetical protein